MEKLCQSLTLVDNIEHTCGAIIMRLHLSIVVVQLLHCQRGVEVSSRVKDSILSLVVFVSTNCEDLTTVTNPLELLGFVALMSLSYHSL